MTNAYEIRGETTAIFLSYKGRRLECLIDTADIPKLEAVRNKLYPGWKPWSETFYVTYMSRRVEDRKTFQLARLLTNAPSGMDVDHVNHRGLDNRQCNLRVVTHSMNLMNRIRARRDSKSGLRGISHHPNGKWRAKLKINGRQKHIGYFRLRRDAIAAVRSLLSNMGVPNA